MQLQEEEKTINFVLYIEHYIDMDVLNQLVCTYAWDCISCAC